VEVPAADRHGVSRSRSRPRVRYRGTASAGNSVHSSAGRPAPRPGP
jgi:hypothetical protein